MVIIIGLGKTGLSCVDYFLGWRDATGDGYPRQPARQGSTAA